MHADLRSMSCFSTEKQRLWMSSRLNITDHLSTLYEYGNGAIWNSGSYGFAIRLKIENGTTVNNLIFTPQAFDLTAMFGSGKEPTIEEFKAMFPEEYYPYSEPTLLPFKGQALKTTDSNDNIVDTLDINITTFKGTRADGTHEVMFPEGLKKAGNVYDEINYKTGKAIKRVDSVDMGMLNWAKYTSGKGYFGAMLSRKPQTGGALLCVKYTFQNTNGWNASGDDKTINSTWYNINCAVNVKDSAYTTADAFKTAMSGVMLYYELAEPIEYTIDGFIQEPKRILANTTSVQDVKEVYAG